VPGIRRNINAISIDNLHRDVVNCINWLVDQGMVRGKRMVLLMVGRLPASALSAHRTQNFFSLAQVTMLVELAK